VEKEDEKHRLCYPTKYSDKVYDVYYSRYKLYKTFYQNHKSNGVDLMIADILQYASKDLKNFNFIGACSSLKNGDPIPYMRLNDNIL
jgi:HD superfamily phosphohydrolase